MDLVGKAKRVRIYVNEGDHVGHRSVHLAILELLRRENASGATAVRAIEGFSGAGQIHTTRVVDVEAKLPVVIEWIDRPEIVERLLPRIKQMVRRGLITVDDTDVALYDPTQVRDVSSGLAVAEVMTADVASVNVEMPVRQVAELMLGSSYRAVPVVDGERRAIGIISNSDLVRRGGLGMRIELLQSRETQAIHAELERLASDHKTAAEIMTPRPVTIPATTPLTEAARIMAQRRLKRLPVVDENGTLIGIISRVDLLRTVAGPSEGQAAETPVTGLSGDTPLRAITRRDVPAVRAETPLAEVLQAVVSTRLNRVVVVDAERRVVGVVTDAEVLDRVTPALHPSVLRTLVHRLPLVHPKPEELEAERHATAQTAADLMRTDVAVAPEEATLRDALALMLPSSRKVVAVVDENSRYLGLVDRADLLRGLVLSA